MKTRGFTFPLGKYLETELEWLKAFLRAVTFVEGLRKEKKDGLEVLLESHEGADAEH